MRLGLISPKVLRAGFGALIWAGFAVQSAAALSCMAPDLPATMEEAKASEKIYHIIVGEFKLVSKTSLPRTDIPHGMSGADFPEAQLAEMRFDGVSLSPSARNDVPLSGFHLDVETSCAAHWCGSLPREGQTMIAFIEARPAQKPILHIGACPKYLFWTQDGDGKVETLRRLF